jgi:hypothetical protein
VIGRPTLPREFYDQALLQGRRGSATVAKFRIPVTIVIQFRSDKSPRLEKTAILLFRTAKVSANAPDFAPVYQPHSTLKLGFWSFFIPNSSFARMSFVIREN